MVRLGRQRDSAAKARKIGDSRWVICAAPAYIAAHGTPREPEDLLQLNCLNFAIRTHRVAWTIRRGGRDIALAVKGNAASSHAEMLRQLALAGIGIIRVSDFVVAADVAAGRLVPLLDTSQGEPREPIFALYHAQRNVSPRIRVFVDFLEEKLRGYGGRG